MMLRRSLAVSAASLLLAVAQTPPAEPAAPKLPATATKLSDFAPAGWAVEQQQAADLNRDGRTDALLILRRQRTRGTPERVIAAALRQREARGGYVLAEMNAGLIPSSDDPDQEDPMAEGELKVRRGGFDLKFALAAGAGSYQMAVVRYRFRYEHGCFRLVGYDRMQTHRATMATTDTSVNFLTGLVITRIQKDESAVPSERRETLKRNRRRCLGELGSAATFDPLQALRIGTTVAGSPKLKRPYASAAIPAGVCDVTS
jgi:hypothetical protein